MKRKILAIVLVLCLFIGFPVLVYGGDDEDVPTRPTISLTRKIIPPIE